MKRKNDPINGQFAKGNPGRAKGSKNVRTLQWEELGKEIAEVNAGRFNELLSRLWDSPDLSDQLRAADLFLKMVEFFKPKLQRISNPDNGAGMKTEVILPTPRIVIERHVIGADGSRRFVEDEPYSTDKSLHRS